MSVWKCGRFELPLGAKTYVMGILNATPDSFSGDGVFHVEKMRPGVLQTGAIERALQMIEDGADILDIGGQSTRPGATPVSPEEELDRVLPLVESLVSRVEIPISVDTTKAVVARGVLHAGARIINDISAATFDEEMPGVLQSSDCGVVLMHLRGTPTDAAGSKFQVPSSEFNDVIMEIKAFWEERFSVLRAGGIEANRLCLDAGFGFGKSVEENLEILRRGRELRDFARTVRSPILSGTSRKSTIGKVSSEELADKRIWGTAAATAIAIHNGADIVRVHDVKEMAQVARVADAISRRPV